LPFFLLSFISSGEKWWNLDHVDTIVGVAGELVIVDEVDVVHPDTGSHDHGWGRAVRSCGAIVAALV
jgi:hypothetical protein